MKELQYVGATLVMSNAGAEAVLGYAEALARGSTSAIVNIPILRADGTRDIANLLLGPSSQIFAATKAGPDVDLDDAAQIEVIQALIRALAPVRAETLPAPIDGDLDHVPSLLM